MTRRVIGWVGRVFVVAAVSALLGGCAGSGPFLTTPDDYAAYRATRVARTFEGRLAAAAAYLKRHPRGVFVAEVRAYLRRAEPVYYDVKRGSAAGLRAYLETLPEGAFSKEASARLRELDRVRDAGDLLVRAASETERRLDREQAERRRVREAPATWVTLFLDGAAWDRPLSEAPAAVLVPYSLGLPQPVCGPADGPEGADVPRPEGTFRCAKLLELPYVVKVDAATEPRQATLEIAVIEDASGALLEVRVGGPDLFSRLEEARSLAPVAADDATGRIGGISQAVDIARDAFRRRVADDPACRRQPISPVVLDLACGGFRLVVRAAVEPGGDDVIVITRHEAASPAAE